MFCGKFGRFNALGKVTAEKHEHTDTRFCIVRNPRFSGWDWVHSRNQKN